MILACQCSKQSFVGYNVTCPSVRNPFTALLFAWPKRQGHSCFQAPAFCSPPSSQHPWFDPWCHVTACSALFHAVIVVPSLLWGCCLCLSSVVCGCTAGTVYIMQWRSRRPSKSMRRDGTNQKSVKIEKKDATRLLPLNIEPQFPYVMQRSSAKENMMSGFSKANPHNEARQPVTLSIVHLGTGRGRPHRTSTLFCPVVPKGLRRYFCLVSQNLFISQTTDKKIGRRCD